MIPRNSLTQSTTKPLKTTCGTSANNNELFALVCSFFKRRRREKETKFRNISDRERKKGTQRERERKIPSLVARFPFVIFISFISCYRVIIPQNNILIPHYLVCDSLSLYYHQFPPTFYCQLSTCFAAGKCVAHLFCIFFCCCFVFNFFPPLVVWCVWFYSCIILTTRFITYNYYCLRMYYIVTDCISHRSRLINFI